MRFNHTTKYTNVGEGEHSVVIFVSPNVLKRYFDEGKTFKDTWLKFSMKVNGLREQSVDTIYVGGRPLKKGQALTLCNQFFNSDQSKLLENVLLQRDKTPFRSIQFDQFDSIAVEGDK